MMGWAGEWRKRVAADVAASVPGMVTAGTEHLAAPEDFESVRGFLLRTPHEYVKDPVRWARDSSSRACACGQEPGAPVHSNVVLFRTYPYLAGVAQALNLAAGRGEAVPDLIGDAPADLWAAEALTVPEPSPLSPAALEAALLAAAFPGQEPHPQAPAPEPLPDDVIGYVVILPGRVFTAASREAGTVAWLANADLMGREHAEHMAQATGGTVAEVRAVTR